MKKIIRYTILSFVILSLLASCYIPAGEKMVLTVTDHGRCKDNPDYHLIEVDCSSPFAEIRYTFLGNEEDNSSGMFQAYIWSESGEYIESSVQLMNGIFERGMRVRYGTTITFAAIEGGLGYINSDNYIYTVPYY